MAELMYTFGVFVQCEELRINASAICWCAEGCNLTAVYQKQVFFENLHRFGCISQLLYSCPLMPQTEFFIVMFEALQNRSLKICPVDF